MKIGHAIVKKYIMEAVVQSLNAKLIVLRWKTLSAEDAIQQISKTIREEPEWQKQNEVPYLSNGANQ